MADESTVPFPGELTANPKDIIKPKNPFSPADGGEEFIGGDSNTDSIGIDPKLLDGSDVSTMLGGETESGIWWWCIAYNKQTFLNLDFVYATSTVLFDWFGCNLMLQEFVDSFIDGNSLSVSFLTLDYTSQLNELFGQKPFLTDEQYIAQLKAIQNLADPVDGNFTSLIDSSNVYSLVSFRRLLNPEDEYLEHRTEIDEILEKQFTFDLLAMDRALNKDNSILSTLMNSKAILQDQLNAVNRNLNLLGPDQPDLVASLNNQKALLEEQIRKVDEQITKLNNGRF